MKPIIVFEEAREGTQKFDMKKYNYNAASPDIVVHLEDSIISTTQVASVVLKCVLEGVVKYSRHKLNANAASAEYLCIL